MHFNYDNYWRIGIILLLLTGCTHRDISTIISYDIGFYFQKEAAFRVRCIIPKENWKPISENQDLWKTEIRHFYIDTIKDDTIFKKKINCNFELEQNRGYGFFIQNIGEHGIDKQVRFIPLVVITNTPETLFIDKFYQGLSSFVKLSKEDVQIGNKHPDLLEVEGKYNDNKWQPVVYVKWLPKKQLIPETKHSDEIGLNFPTKGVFSIRANIQSHEWVQHENMWRAKLYTFTITSENDAFKKYGFYEKDNCFALDVHASKDKHLPLYIFMHDFSQKPGLLEFESKSKIMKDDVFVPFKQSNFMTARQKPTIVDFDKYMLNNNVYPSIHLYFSNQIMMIQTIASNDIINVLSDTAYLEYVKENCVIKTGKISSEKMIQSFSPTNMPDSVRLCSVFNKFEYKMNNRNIHCLDLEPHTQIIQITDKGKHPISDVNIEITKAEWIQQLYTTQSYATDETSYIKSILTSIPLVHHLYSETNNNNEIANYTQNIQSVLTGRTNQAGMISFFNWGLPLSGLRVNCLKNGFIPVRNIKIHKNHQNLPMNIALDPIYPPLTFDFQSCHGEKTHVHIDNGYLEIIESGQVVVKLSPAQSNVMPVFNKPTMSYKHPAFEYQEIQPPSDGHLIIIPLYKILPAGKIYGFIAIDATNNDPKEIAFIRMKNAVSQYLNTIGWKSESDQMKVASVFMEYVKPLKTIDDINNEFSKGQADSSLVEQLKKIFNISYKSIHARQVIYMVSSQRANIIAPTNLVERFDIDQLKEQKIVFNCIVVGEYGGELFQDLATQTNGRLYRCKTMDDIVQVFSQIFGDQTNMKVLLPCKQSDIESK